MSSTKTFNGLGGTVATRESLIELQLQAKAESNTEVYKRVSKLLNAYPDTAKFELEVESFIEEKKAISLTLKTTKKGEELHYMYNETKVASVNIAGVITWHKKGIAPNHRAKIRKDAKTVGLNAPQEETIPIEILTGIEEETQDHEEIYGLGKAVSPDDVYNIITNRMLELIKAANKGDYERAWNDEGYLIPYNFISKKPYRGINNLMLTPIFGTLDNPYYLTFAQIQEKGGKVKKGSTGHQVVYFSKTQREYSDQEIQRINKSAGSEIAKKGDKKEFLFLKYYNVFSGSDVEGINFDLENFKLLGKVSNDIKAGENEKIELAEEIVKHYPKPSPKIEFKGNKAFFSPSKDLVSMPAINKFKSSQDFYRTFFHELSHSTGHKNRLKRDLSGSFGSKEYAFEELTAEFGAVFLSANAGIMFYTNKNHASYLKGWNEVLVPQMKEDNRFLMRASSAAQKAADFILDLDNKKEIQKPKITKTVKSIPKSSKKISKPAKKIPVKKVPETSTNPKGFSIKPKSISVQTAVKDVLGLDKFNNLRVKELTANLLFKTFKNAENLEDLREINSEYEIAILSKESMFHYYDTYEVELTNIGAEFIKAVKGRLESLRNQKHNLALFDGLASPVTEQIETIYTAINPQPQIIQIVEPVKEFIPAPEPEKELKVIAPKNKLMSMHFDSLPMDEGWENLMQNPAKNMKIAIWGPPKNGKTAGSLQLANYLTKFGRVLYNFADQGFNLSTQELWKKSGLAENPSAEPSDANTLDALEKEIITIKPTFVFIDMISDYIRKEKIRPEEFKQRFIQAYPETSFILIFEVTKGGNFKGDQGWTHLVDAIVTVEDFLMENRGRYGMGYHIVWDEGFERYNPKKYDEVKEFLEPESEALEFTEIERI